MDINVINNNRRISRQTKRERESVLKRQRERETQTQSQRERERERERERVKVNETTQKRNVTGGLMENLVLNININ